jgi:hypothetical protein
MKLELVIPTTLSEIPLKHYQKFLAIAEKTNDEVFLAEKMIECFCGIELKQVVKLPYKEIENLSNHFGTLFEKKTNFKNRFTIAGKEFGFIPNLEEISWGEYIDLEANISDLNTFHKAMAVMYRPIVEKHGDKYKIEPYVSSANYAEVMEYAPLDICLAAKIFFWNFEKELLQATLHYLEKEVETMTSTNTAKKRSLENNGDGFSQYTQLLKVMSDDLTTLPEWDYSNALPTLLSKSRKMRLNQEKLKEA